MPIVYTDEYPDRLEIVRSPDRSKWSAKRAFWGAYTENEGEVIAWADTILSPLAVYAGLPINSYKVTTKGGGVWDLDVDWSESRQSGDAQDRQTNSSTFSFDTGGGTQHITQALAQQGWSAVTNANDPPQSGNSADIPIGLDGDSVEGVDIKIPQLAFSVTHYLPAALMTRQYIGHLFRLTGKANANQWFVFKGGEVLLEGVSGSKRGIEDWELSFKFSAQENRSNINLGKTPDNKTLIVGEKLGWEYLWIQYGAYDNTTDKRREKRPVAAFTAQVYSYDNFADLGIEASLNALIPQ